MNPVTPELNLERKKKNPLVIGDQPCKTDSVFLLDSFRKARHPGICVSVLVILCNLLTSHLAFKELVDVYCMSPACPAPW